MKKKIITLISLVLLTLGSFAFTMGDKANVNEYGKCGSDGCGGGQCQMK